MKQQLWMLNSSLLLILIVTLFLSILLQQTPQPFRVKPAPAEEPSRTRELSDQEVEDIYKFDLFGTFYREETQPSQKSLVTPVPKPKIEALPQAPVVEKPSFLPALNATLKGIAYSVDDKKSICILEDETKKEQVYHVGDLIRDAQIIKIAQDRVTLLRVNGQHETIYLREDSAKKLLEEKVTWAQLVKKIDDKQYEIDFLRFPKEINSVGSLTEMLALLTAYKEGKPIGLKVTNFTPNSAGPFLGLEKNDIITAINGVTTAEKADRIKIYEMVTQMKQGDSVKLDLLRNDQPITLAYNLTEIKKPVKRVFEPEKEGQPQEGKQTEDDRMFKLSKLQEREQERREFSETHQEPDIISEIRKRLLENMKSRVLDTRIR